MPIFEFDQERIYDLRYGSGYNGMGSPVNVLTAERMAMTDSLRRLQATMPEGAPTTIIDYGYGMGRVPNELVTTWIGPGDLTVYAYDAARVGLCRALKQMSIHLPTVTTYDETDRIVGECTSTRNAKYKRTIRFIHGNPADNPKDIANILLEENDGEFDIATSWYDPISHEPSRKRRRDLFTMLGSLTHSRGEVIITASTTGDLIPAYLGEDEALTIDINDAHGNRDVVYTTEIGEDNYIHLYGPKDFKDCMRATRTDVSQEVWLQPIRLPGNEYETSVEEQAAYGKLRKWAERHRDKKWGKQEFAALHTVGGFRSSSPPVDQKFL